MAFFIDAAGCVSTVLPGGRLRCIVAATAAMGAAVGYGLLVGNHLFARAGASPVGRLAMLCVRVTLGIAIYTAALPMLGIVRLKEIVAGLRTRT